LFAQFNPPGESVEEQRLSIIKHPIKIRIFGVKGYPGTSGFAEARNSDYTNKFPLGNRCNQVYYTGDSPDYINQHTGRYTLMLQNN